MKLDDQIRAAYKLGLVAWERLVRVGATRFDAEALFNALPELRVHLGRVGKLDSGEERAQALALVRMVEEVVDEMEFHLLDLGRSITEDGRMPEVGEAHLPPWELAEVLASTVELGATDATREIRRALIADLRASRDENSGGPDLLN